MKIAKRILTIALFIIAINAEYSKYGRDEYEMNGLRYFDNDTM